MAVAIFDLDSLLQTEGNLGTYGAIHHENIPATTELWVSRSRSNETTANYSSVWNSSMRPPEVAVHHRGGYLECREFSFFFNGVVILILCLLGMIGNSVSFLVLRKDNSNQVATFLLQALAVTDNSVLAISFTVLGFICGVLPYSSSTRSFTQSALPYVVKYIQPLAYMTQTCAVWMTVLLAINRYFAICRPFDAPRLCTMSKARIQVASVFIFSLAFNVPRFFQYRITDNLEYKQTAIGSKSLFGTVYTNALYTVLVLVLPLIILLVLNIKLVLELQTMRQRRNSLSSHSGTRDSNINLIMIIIIVTFVICNVPDRIQIILKNNASHIFKKSGPCGFIFYFMNTCNLLIVCSSSTNFFIYYFFRARFRRILLLKLCSWSDTKRYRLGSISGTNKHTSIRTSLVSLSTIRRLSGSPAVRVSCAVQQNKQPKNMSVQASLLQDDIPKISPVICLKKSTILLSK